MEVLSLVLLMLLGIAIVFPIITVWRHHTKTDPQNATRAARYGVGGLILVLAAGAIGYRLLVKGQLEQTAALFIGLPTFLALIVVLTPPAKSATGMIIKGITLFLLMSGIVLGEGFICIVMSAPLFYLIGLIVGGITDYFRKRKQRGLAEGHTALHGVLLLPLLLMSLEGVSGPLSFPRAQEVRRERVIQATPEEVRHALARQAVFTASLPLYLRLGFPQPVATWGKGLDLGSQRGIRFTGGEGRPAELVAELVAVGPQELRFVAVSDTSPIAHWLAWRESHISWRSEGLHATRVTWTIRYHRHLDPAWYFAPWQRYAVGQVAEYLLANLATPAP